MNSFGTWTGSLLVGVVTLVVPSSGRAYIDTPPLTFGALCELSRGVVVFKVVSTDAKRRVVVLDKARDLKRAFPADRVTLALGPDDESAGKLVAALEKDAEFAAFYLQGKTTCATYLYLAGTWHYGAITRGDDDRWTASTTPSPRLLGAYAGKSDELAGLAKKVLAGEEVEVSVLAGTPKELGEGGGKPARRKASLKRFTLDPVRDAVVEKE